MPIQPIIYHHIQTSLKTKINAMKKLFIHTIAIENVKTVFQYSVDDISLFLKQLDEYPQRALLMASENDYILLNSYPEQSYLDYLKTIGLGTELLLVPKGSSGSLSKKLMNDLYILNKLKKEQIEIHPYISTASNWDIAEEINSTVFGSTDELTKKANSKIFLREILQTLSITSTQCEITDTNSVIQKALALIEKFDRIIIRGDNSCGGSAIWKIADRHEIEILEKVLENRQDNTHYLIEEMYPVSSSPNVQYEISDKSLNRLLITDQLLDADLNHFGNRYPYETDQKEIIIEYSDKISLHLQKLGYRGFLGIDFIITDKNQVFPIEINARANTSSYAIKAMEKLFPKKYRDKFFLIKNGVSVDKKIDFDELKNILGRKNIFYKDQGILPYNTGCLKWGKFDALIIGNSHQQTERILENMNKNIQTFLYGEKH